MNQDISKKLGQRIIEAANLAVALHLESGAMNIKRHSNQQGRLKITGGAGFDVSRDGALSLKDARRGRSSFLAERKAS